MTRLAHTPFAPLVALVVVALAAPAAALIPKADRIERAATDANKAGGRSQALKIELTLRVADRAPIGSGEIVTHPSGLARLELFDASHAVERHLLVGTQLSATRDGEPLTVPRVFLPPLFLFQSDTPLALRSALSDFGLDPEAVGLAPCGERVCYVLGDPRRAPPPPPPSEKDMAARAGAALDDALDLDDDAGKQELRADLHLDAEPGAPAPSLWLDTLTFEPVRLQSRGGVIVDFGPMAAFGKVRFPAWIRITEPGRETVQLDVSAVTPVNAPAADFGRAWLTSPPNAESRPGGRPFGDSSAP